MCTGTCQLSAGHHGGGGEERSRNGTDGIATHASSSSASGHRLEQPPTLPGMRSWAPSLASLQGPASVLVSVGKAEGARVGGPVRPRSRRGFVARARALDRPAKRMLRAPRPLTVRAHLRAGAPAPLPRVTAFQKVSTSLTSRSA